MPNLHMCPAPHWTSGRPIKSFTQPSPHELAFGRCSRGKCAPRSSRTLPRPTPAPRLERLLQRTGRE
eukprot:8987085-Alexandrium_andersonii.AAC.1